MFFVEQYHSLANIELEYQESLERLLSMESPSFKWCLEKDKACNRGDTYYVIFASNKNEPVGLIQIRKKSLQEEKKRSFWPFKSKKSWMLSSDSFFVSGSGIIISPTYKDQLSSFIKNIFIDLIDESMESGQVNTGQLETFEFPHSRDIMQWRRPVILYKSFEEYEVFKQNLLPDTLRKIQAQELLADRNKVVIKEYKNFKEYYLTLDNDSAEELMKNQLLRHFFNVDQEVSIILKDNIALNVLMFCPGQMGQLFIDAVFGLQFDENDYSHIIINHCIKKFYANSAAKKLKFVSNPSFQKGIMKALTEFPMTDILGKTYLLRPTTVFSKYQEELSKNT